MRAPRREAPPHFRGLEFAGSMAALAGALVVNFLAGRMADAAGRNAHVSPDLLLNWLPVVDTSVIYTWGFGAFLGWLIIATLWRERRRAAYIAWVYAILITVRSFFIILTPMKLPPQAIHVEGDPLFQAIGRYLTFRNDLFFSSHTALPFLAFLLYRGTYVRLSFLAFSFMLASAVLLGRLHYSIDVFGAYFITYAVYRLELIWFQRPYFLWRERYLRELTEPRPAPARAGEKP